MAQQRQIKAYSGRGGGLFLRVVSSVITGHHGQEPPEAHAALPGTFCWHSFCSPRAGSGPGSSTTDPLEPEHPPHHHMWRILPAEGHPQPVREKLTSLTLQPDTTALCTGRGERAEQKQVWKRFIALFPCGSTDRAGKRPNVCPTDFRKITGYTYFLPTHN